MVRTPSENWSILQVTNITGEFYNVRFNAVGSCTPVDMLKAFYRSITEHIPLSLQFDADGWDYVLVCSDTANTIITYGPVVSDASLSDVDLDSNTLQCIEFNEDKYCLARELCRDIAEDIVEWSWWGADSLEEASKNKIHIMRELFNLIDVLGGKSCSDVLNAILKNELGGVL